MQKIIILVLTVFFSFSATAEHRLNEKDESNIRKLIQQQVDAWNEGNLEKFMETYWKSDQLSFVGSRGPTYGWQATLDNYKKGYPDKKAMGHLDLKVLKLTQIDKKTVLMIGRFELTREIGDAAGHFTLVIQKIEGEWKIISDHSSAEK
ncbi:nuclear transport factor 2 family protein [Maribellus sp. YY47]|uniref:YybH family protein n=1 Tax=Maribellus sp. YY47 TaxID=2929486 RepID=UPI002001232B|nr:nuclear transport factor 2 family protein [Maribellus sp. YY47]MCK3684313.1 nuclear transport factor 2 family protein [Maribellus sp. YY47]